MMKQMMIAGAACLAFTAAGANAQAVDHKPIEEKNLESGKAQLQADKAYIYVTSPYRVNGMFLKTPDGADIAEYEADWREKLDKEQKKYPNRLKRYETDRAVWLKTRKGRSPEKPVEPTEESFSIGDITSRMIVTFGPQFVYGKGQGDEKSFSYLVEVEPGTYSYYGPIFYAPNAAAMGTCYCMGTVKFDAAAGQVTSLGDFLSMGWVSDEAARLSSVAYDPEFKRDPKPADFSAPARLVEFGAVPADLRAAGKINNIFGIMVGRMPPVEGVLAYDRDVPIDVKGLAAKTAAEAMPQSKVEPMAEEKMEAELAGDAPEGV